MTQNSVQIVGSEQSFSLLLKGAEQLAYAVGVTLGPMGRNVLFPGESGPVVTKDGVTVAHKVLVDHPGENLAIQMIQQAAAKAASSTGDGTTTSTILAYNFLKRAEKCLANGADPMSVKRGLDLAVLDALSLLPTYALPPTEETAKHVATISANGDESIGRLVGEAFNSVGVDGLISVQPSKSNETSLVVTEGTVIPKGVVSPYFLKEPTRRMENVYVLYANTRVAKRAPMLSLLQRLKRKDPSASFLVVGAPVEGDALQFLVQNYQGGHVDCAAINSPGVGEHHIDYLWDLASSSGGGVIGDEMGLKYHGDIDLDILGHVPLVEISRNQTRFLGIEDNPGRAERISLLRQFLESETNPAQLQRFQDRLTTLSSGIAVIYLGGTTSAERGETFFRLEDALGAARTALKDGVIPGGGTVLARVSAELLSKAANPSAHPSLAALSSDELDGYVAAATALLAPYTLIWENSGRDTPDLSALSRQETFDVVSNKAVDALAAGILDPLKVTHYALISAATSAGLLISTSCLLIPEGYQ